MLIRNLSDWQNYLKEVSPTRGDLEGSGALIIPGGESTAMTRIIRDEALYEPVREAILGGLPVFGTCAGLIMLDGAHLGTMDIQVRRNAYGRQLGSFEAVGKVEGIGDDVPLTFIRAPYIESVGKDVKVLSTVDGHIVAAQQGKQLVTAFHPELTQDTRLHEYFLQLVKG